MSIFLLGLMMYFVIGAAITLCWCKFGGLDEDAFALIVWVLWPLFNIAAAGFWIWEKTPWYKRLKWRRKLRVAVSEENETDESFLRRSKRL